MKGRVICILAGLLALAFSPLQAQNTVVEESVTTVDCDSPTHATIRRREVVTILNEQGARHANFACSCSRQERLTSFRGQVTDNTGRLLRKLKESDLQRTEYSQYLAVDNYTMYIDYTPPAYPVTITYEWTMDNSDNLVEFPWFCPQEDYDISVRQATYRLSTPKSFPVRHALNNIGQTAVTITDGPKDTQVLTLQLNDLPALRQEPFTRPLRERLPMAYFVPVDFTYYNTHGSLRNWVDYGLWEYSLLQGRDALPEEVKAELHQLTDHLTTAHEKVEAVYRHLAKTTRYVAVLLGIGGLQPAPAATVCKSGFGDCKGLSNYMRAMLQEIGIASNYTTISTVNRKLISDFASVGQMNHVILQVPLPEDTIWIECTNPTLPLGYVHEDIAGHDAIVITPQGGQLVRLPVYADTTNLQRTAIAINLSADGTADITLSQESHNRQYENCIPLLNMSTKDRQSLLQQMMRAPQLEVTRLDVREAGSSITLDAEVRSKRYATTTGQRFFVPIYPIHQSYKAPPANADRQEDVQIEMGYLDETNITLSIPEDYEIEAQPKSVTLEQPFGSFTFQVKTEGQNLHANYRLLMKAGTYDKTLYPLLIDFIKTVGTTYDQKLVLKKT